MKTIELAKKALTRVAEVAVTQDQFDKWDSGKKAARLKERMLEARNDLELERQRAKKK